jgi:heme/copper-type cytochrome/quinol oxidase subunit 3
MKRGTKQTIFWVLAAAAVIIVVFVLMNWESFTQGYEAGSQLAE